MKLKQIVDIITKRLSKIQANPQEYYLNFGDFRIKMTGFSFTMDESSYYHNNIKYYDNNRGSTIRVQGRVSREVLPYLEEMCYGSGSFTRDIVIEPSGMLLAGAFIESYELSYEDAVSKTFVYDMKITASHIINQ